MKMTDLTREKFGRLTVIGRAEKRGKHLMWNCSCDCGGTSVVSSSHLRSGHSKSCGCIRNEICANRSRENAKHGMWNTPEWNSWKSMIDRCTRQTHPKYDLYGGRGISVCQEWRDSFELFFSHIGKKPSRGHSIDRIDTNKGYEPGNVRWADDFQQNNNRRSNVTVEIDGNVLTAAQVARKFGITHRAAIYRIKHGKPMVADKAWRYLGDGAHAMMDSVLSEFDE